MFFKGFLQPIEETIAIKREEDATVSGGTAKQQPSVNDPSDSKVPGVGGGIDVWEDVVGI